MPTTGPLRPGRRERRPATPLFPISTYTPLDGSTRGNRAKHESRPYATAGKTGQAPSLSPVETCEISEISPSVKCRYKGEKVPTTDLLRPGLRERRPATALFLISKYTPLDGSTGERGRSTDVLSTATPREIRAWHLSPCRANIGSTGERGPAADFSRPGGRERVPGADLLSTATSREIRAWHSLSTATSREIRAWHSLSRWRSRESARRGFSLDRHAQRNPRLALSLDRHADRNPRSPTLPPVEPMLPKIFKVQNRKKKKVPTKLPSFESSRREPHFYRIARIRSERDLILAFFYRKIYICKSVWVPKDASLGDASFGPKGFMKSPKGKPGHAFSSLGPPPVPEFGHF